MLHPAREKMWLVAGSVCQYFNITERSCWTFRLHLVLTLSENGMRFGKLQCSRCGLEVAKAEATPKLSLPQVNSGEEPCWGRIEIRGHPMCTPGLTFTTTRIEDRGEQPCRQHRPFSFASCVRSSWMAGGL